MLRTWAATRGAKPARAPLKIVAADPKAATSRGVAVYDSGMKNTVMRRKAFWSAFWCGMAAPGLLFASDSTRIARVEARPIGARDAMRGDWMKIGGDFRTVMVREEASSKQQ